SREMPQVQGNLHGVTPEPALKERRPLPAPPVVALGRGTGERGEEGGFGRARLDPADAPRGPGHEDLTRGGGDVGVPDRARYPSGRLVMASPVHPFASVHRT